MARTIVIAPDSFKGSATAAEIAEAIGRGWSSVRPDDDVRLLPMADGGEGTLDAFEVAVPGAKRKPVRVTGPVGDPVDAAWLLLPDGTAVVELALTSGITLLDPLRPFEAQTVGFGEAIAAALDGGATALLLAIGGSSSTDGGLGALQALGAKATDAAGRAVSAGNAGLADLDTLDLSELRQLPEHGARVLSDVTNPLFGEHGAAAVFGPQKGASPDDIAVLDANLARLAKHVDVDPGTPGAGAAGGAGFGLLAWGATLDPGSAAVGDALGAPDVIGDADVVITGEGRYDSQSAGGKVPSYIAGLAGEHTRTLLVAGLVDADPAELFDDSESLTDIAGGLDAAIADSLTHAREAGARLARRMPGGD
ncbi:glycerate kinase [Paramicrobacterium humi]|uniref:Glycerate kinase n=1 Tax=Paramicrobacterium humi TaxID=640635 RepID=A0A1H4J6Q1_9MICO|nr:glycerate kinase [Microbacterium humi]SEB41980.1 glycerate kinase [Microbacterium humi]